MPLRNMLEIVNVKREIPSQFESVNKFSDTITIENRVPYVSLIFPDHKDVNPIIHELIKNNVCHQTYTGALSTTPQNGSGLIICKAINASTIFNLLKMWRESYSISFKIKPAITNEELLEINSSEEYWSKN